MVQRGSPPDPRAAGKVDAAGLERHRERPAAQARTEDIHPGLPRGNLDCRRHQDLAPGKGAADHRSQDRRGREFPVVRRRPSFYLNRAAASDQCGANRSRREPQDEGPIVTAIRGVRSVVHLWLVAEPETGGVGKPRWFIEGLRFTLTKQERLTSAEGLRILLESSTPRPTEQLRPIVRPACSNASTGPVFAVPSGSLIVLRNSGDTMSG